MKINLSVYHTVSFYVCVLGAIFDTVASIVAKEVLHSNQLVLIFSFSGLAFCLGGFLHYFLGGFKK
jgi:hypothetical protein